MKHPHLALAPCKWPQLWFHCSDCSSQLWFTGQVPEALLGAPLVTISPVGFLGVEDVCTEGVTEPCTESTQDILKMWHQPGRTASDFSGCSHFPFSCHLTNAGAHKKAAAETSNPIFQNVRVRISPASSSHKVCYKYLHQECWNFNFCVMVGIKWRSDIDGCY